MAVIRLVELLGALAAVRAILDRPTREDGAVLEARAAVVEHHPAETEALEARAAGVVVAEVAGVVLRPQAATVGSVGLLRSSP